METIGKEGDLGGQEREERTLEETHGGDEWQRLKHGPKSQIEIDSETQRKH